MAMASEEQLRCERECARLCNDFIYTIDRRQYDAFIDLFTSDALLDRAGAVFNGHDGLRQFCEARPIDRYVRHACSNIRVDMTGPTTATGASCVTLFQALALPDAALPLKPTAAPLFAEYVDDYVLTSSGWKFMQRKIIPVFVP